jgi:elongator complex protein 2
MSEGKSENMADEMIKSRYLSAGANRYAAAADWSEDGLVAFGSDSNVCLWDPTVSFPSTIF